MALSYQEGVLDAGTSSVVITIDFMKDVDLTVALDDVVISAYTIQMSTPPILKLDAPVAVDGTKLNITRNTAAADLSQKFAKGSRFTPNNLDNLHYQLLFIAQEIKERGTNTMFTDLDMNFHRIIRLGKHVEPTDAMQWQEFIDHLTAQRYVADVPEGTPREKSFARTSRGWVEIAGDGGIPDAPDAAFYVRTKGAWVQTADPANATPDVPTDQTGLFLRKRIDDITSLWVPYEPPVPPEPPAIKDDAPKDGKTYGRKNGAWEEAKGGGGGDTPLPADTVIGDACVKTKTATGEVWAPLGTNPSPVNALDTSGIVTTQTGNPAAVTLVNGLGVDCRTTTDAYPSSNWMSEVIKYSTFEHPVLDTDNPAPVKFNFSGLPTTLAANRKYIVDLVAMSEPNKPMPRAALCGFKFGSTRYDLIVGQNGANSPYMTWDLTTQVNIKAGQIRVVLDFEKKTLTAYQVDMNCNIIPDTTVTQTVTGVMDRGDCSIEMRPYFKYEMWGQQYEAGQHIGLRRIVFGNYFVGIRPATQAVADKSSTCRAAEVYTNIPAANIDWSFWPPYDRVRGAYGFDNVTESTDPNAFAYQLIDNVTVIDGTKMPVDSGISLKMNDFYSIPLDAPPNQAAWDAQKLVHHLRRGREWVPLTIPAEGFAPNNTQDLPCMRSKNVYEPLATLDRTYSFEELSKAVTKYNPMQAGSDYLNTSLKVGCTTTVYYNIPNKALGSNLDVTISVPATSGGDQYIIFEGMKVSRLSNIQPTSTDDFVYKAGSVFAVRMIVTALDNWEMHVMHQVSETDQTMVVGTVFKNPAGVNIPANNVVLKLTRNSGDYTNTGMMCIVDSLRGIEYTTDAGLIVESTEPLCSGKVCDGQDVRTNEYPEAAAYTYNLNVLSKAYVNWTAGAPNTTPSVREYGNTADVNSAPLLWSPQAGCFVPLNGLKATTAAWAIQSKEGRSWFANSVAPLVIGGWDWVSRTALLIDGSTLTNGATTNAIEFYESMNLTAPRMKITMKCDAGVVTIGVVNADIISTTGVLKVASSPTAPFALSFRPMTDATNGAYTEVAVIDKAGAALGTITVKQLFTSGTVAVLAPTAGNVRLFSLNGRQRRVQPNDDGGKPLISGGAVEHYRGLPVSFPNGVTGTCPVSAVRGFSTATKYVTGYNLA